MIILRDGFIVPLPHRTDEDWAEDKQWVSYLKDAPKYKSISLEEYNIMLPKNSI